MDIRGKVALITGGGTGLGRVIAQQLAREGMQIAIHYSRSEQEARDTVREVQKLGVRTMAVQTDLEDTAAVYVMLARNESMTGEIITVDAGVTL